jgi:hypothetical protein
VLTVCLAAAIVVLYEALHGSISNRLIGVLLPLGSLGLIRVLVALKIIELPDGLSVVFIDRKPKYVEFVKAAACALGAAIWTVVVTGIVSNTYLGAALIVIPAIVLLIAMSIFVVRGLLLR